MEEPITTLKQAGKKGGETTKSKYGVEHYKRISKMALEKRWGVKDVAK